MDSESADSTLCKVGACPSSQFNSQFLGTEVGTLHIKTYLQITSSLLTFFGSNKIVEVY